VAVASSLVACAAGAGIIDASQGPVPSPPDTVGPHPDIKPVDKHLIPTIQIAPRIGWGEGQKPVAAPGVAVQAFASGLDHPRWLLVLPNGDVLVAETNAPPKPEDSKGVKGKVEKYSQTHAGAGTPTAANRVHSLISKIFSFAVDCDLREDNPMARLKKRGAEQTGKRVLDDGEVRTFWRKAVEKPISRQTGLALRLALLTAGRANEVAGSALSEFHHLSQAKAAGWAIPSERVKNKRDFFLPLSPLAVETIKEAMSLLPEGAKVLFPSPRSKERSKSISAHALTVAMARLAETLDGKWSEDPPSPHDLRRTVETRMSALGVRKEDRDACLNHKPRDVGTVHYDMYERHKEKRAAFNRYAREIERVLAETPKNRRG